MQYTTNAAALQRAAAAFFVHLKILLVFIHLLVVFLIVAW